MIQNKVLTTGGAESAHVICILSNKYFHTAKIQKINYISKKYGRNVSCLVQTSFRFHLTSIDDGQNADALSWAMRFPQSGLVRDLHPLDNAHAERTTKMGCAFPGTSHCKLKQPIKEIDCCQSFLYIFVSLPMSFLSLFPPLRPLCCSGVGGEKRMVAPSRHSSKYL